MNPLDHDETGHLPDTEPPSLLWLLTIASLLGAGAFAALGCVLVYLSTAAGA